MERTSSFLIVSSPLFSHIPKSPTSSSFLVSLHLSSQFPSSFTTFKSPLILSLQINTMNSRLQRKSEENVSELSWTNLPYDTVIQLFTLLNYRDRANLSSTCSTWRAFGSSPCLWTSLDLRPHKVNPSLASRCVNLRNLRFRGVESADSIIHLKARNLLELTGDNCRDITDATLSMIVARHELLESIELGPVFCENITSNAIKVIAFCCPNLKILRLSGLGDVTSEAIECLASHCPNLIDLALLDCFKIDEEALGNVLSVKYLSVAGTSNVSWSVASSKWSKLPYLIGLDVSRTDIGPTAVSRMLTSSESLKVMCVLNCHVLEEVEVLDNVDGKVLINAGYVFVDGDDEITRWIEWIVSHTLLRIAESYPSGLEDFWLNEGVKMLLSLMKSAQEDVRERSATGIAIFVVIASDNSIDSGRAESVMENGGIHLLLDLAESGQEGLQTEAAKAIMNLSFNANVAKRVVEKGGIKILMGLVRAMNRNVAEEAAGGLWNLSVLEEHKNAVARAGGVKALVDLIFRWTNSCDRVLERAAGALANLAADVKCLTEVESAGGVHALVTLIRDCKHEGVQLQAARALANLAVHGYGNDDNALIGQEVGALEALVRLTQSPHEGVQQEAASALWNLSTDEKNRETIAEVGGVEALVTLVNSCLNASSTSLQERVAGSLWVLSVSEENSLAIGREGGIPPLIALAQSEVEEVYETATGALWNLAFNPVNAFRIIDEGGVPILVQLSSYSGSKMARFMSTIALAYMLDGRMDEYVETLAFLSSVDEAKQIALKKIEAFVTTFIDPQIFEDADVSTSVMLEQVAEKARIVEVGHLKCSDIEIGRFITMLRNPCSVLKTCAAFTLLQFTIPGGRQAMHHLRLIENGGEASVLRSAAAASNMPREAKIFVKIILRNLEQFSI